MLKLESRGQARYLKANKTLLEANSWCFSFFFVIPRPENRRMMTAGAFHFSGFSLEALPAQVVFEQSSGSSLLIATEQDEKERAGGANDRWPSML